MESFRVHGLQAIEPRVLVIVETGGPQRLKLGSAAGVAGGGEIESPSSAQVSREHGGAGGHHTTFIVVGAALGEMTLQSLKSVEE